MSNDTTFHVTRTLFCCLCIQCRVSVGLLIFRKKSAWLDLWDCAVAVREAGQLLTVTHRTGDFEQDRCGRQRWPSESKNRNKTSASNEKPKASSKFIFPSKSEAWLWIRMSWTKGVFGNMDTSLTISTAHHSETQLVGAIEMLLKATRRKSSLTKPLAGSL